MDADSFPNTNAITSFETLAGKNVSIVSYYVGGSDSFQPTWMTNIRSTGAIPMITFDPTVTGNVDEPTYSLETIINGSHDTYFTEYAKAVAAWGHPFFFRFAPEMNGNWSSWSEGVNGNTKGQYAEAWIHVHNIFTANEATNATWIWCPNVDYTGATPMAELYPGDAYVDWAGLDGYNWGNVDDSGPWQTFPQIFGQSYTELTAITSKPILICEMASAEQDGNKAEWITNTLGTQIFEYPQIKGFVWFNINKETNWTINSSSASLAAFKSAISNSAFQANNYANLGSPIPLP